MKYPRSNVQSVDSSSSTSGSVTYDFGDVERPSFSSSALPSGAALAPPFQPRGNPEAASFNPRFLTREAHERLLSRDCLLLPIGNQLAPKIRYRTATARKHNLPSTARGKVRRRNPTSLLSLQKMVLVLSRVVDIQNITMPGP